MKRTGTINLNRLVFTIDEDACEKLESYLYAIEDRFSDITERNDILGDIEARIAEIFQQKLKASRQVITMEDVNEAITIIGNPYEFGASSQNPGNTTYRPGRPYKHLYRNIDDHVFGGVCSGLGYYWDIDPVIIRILFALAFFGFGFGFLFYVILWIAIPPAITASQKKEMYGQ